MAETKTATKPTANRSSGRALSDGELAAMKETIRERKAMAKSKDPRADGERDVQSKIAEMEAPDRKLAQRLHDIVTEVAPDLWSRTWYGMPAYTRDGKVVLFFKAAAKFNSRYATLGFEEAARLDEGSMWPTSYALTTTASEADWARIRELVKKAAG